MSEYRDQITIKCTASTIKKIDSYIGTDEMTTRNEVVRKALDYFFENWNKPSPKEQFKEWLLSSEGEEFVKDLIRKTRQK